MGFIRRLAVTTAAVTVPPALFVHSNIRRLERDYPRLEPSKTSTQSLRTSPDPESFHTPHVDIYGAKIPARLLTPKHVRGSTESPEQVWARVFFESPIIQLEGKASGGFSRGPGDLGQEGFYQGQQLLNGVCEVIRPPGQRSALQIPLADPAPLLVKWEFPSPGVDMYRTAATKWGLPWRMMSGGRHELSVGDVDTEGMVEVRFASAHDYEWIPEEGISQKVQPRWVGTLHRAFAIWLLDERIKSLKAGDPKGSWQ